LRGVKIGKILIQRDEAQAHKVQIYASCPYQYNPSSLLGVVTSPRAMQPAKLFYSKLPEDIREHHVLLMDPMLASGGTALAAIQVLISEAKLQPKDITFLTLVSCPEGSTICGAVCPWANRSSAYITVFLFYITLRYRCGLQGLSRGHCGHGCSGRGAQCPALYRARHW